MGLPDFVDVIVLNVQDAFDKPYWSPAGRSRIGRVVGSALDLGPWRSGLVDVVVSNSVIEHMGTWADIIRAAREMRAAAPQGWIQPPAFSFAIEPHFALPFVHWLPAPVDAWILRHFPHHVASSHYDVDVARRAIEGNNLLTAARSNFSFPIRRSNGSAYWASPSLSS